MIPQPPDIQAILAQGTRALDQKCPICLAAPNVLCFPAPKARTVGDTPMHLERFKLGAEV